MLKIKSDISYQELEKEVRKIIKKSNHKLEIGFFGTARYPSGVQVASVAFWHNYGKGNNPARPFFTNAVNNNAKNWLSIFADCVKRDKEIKVDKALKMVGNKAVADIKKSITELKTPALAQATIDRKKSSNPLIDTGLLRNSVTYKVSGR